MGKSCSGKSCMVLARLARIKNARRRKSKEAIVRAQIRIEISAPINPMRPHKIFAEALRRQGRRAVAEAQVGLLALTKAGRVGAFALQPGFTYAVTRADGGTEILNAESLFG